MAVENEIPIMLQFMFGEAAEMAKQGASARLLRWSKAMDEWLAERQRKNSVSNYRNSKIAWRRLLPHCGLPPWEIGESDVQAHIERMAAQGYAPNTIRFELSCLSSFYRWCNQHETDPQCGQDFNPVAEVPAPKQGARAEAEILSRSEARALLKLVKRDESLLGKRDYAFFLARLQFGVQLKTLQQLRWGQIEQDQAAAWVRWQPEAERAPLPTAVWDAIRAYLQASGRMAGIRPEIYIFAPLSDPLNREPSGDAADWHPQRFLTVPQIRNNLKLYGRLAGIPEAKLTLPTLRRTAAALRLEAGDSWEQMYIFRNSHSQTESTKKFLKSLLPIPRDKDNSGGKNHPGEAHPADESSLDSVKLPARKPRSSKPGDGIKHGYYAQCQPEDEVLAVMAEGIVGIDAEIIGLRSLSRVLLKRQKEAGTSGELALFSNAYTLAADRLREMIKAEKQLQQPSEDEAWAEAFLSMLDNAAMDWGEESFAEQVRQEALGSDPDLEAGSRRLIEEIASTRVTLRRAYSQALETEDVREQVRLTEIYGSSCTRLVRMLKAESAAQGKLADFLRAELDAAILDVNKEFGLDLGG